MIDTGVKTSELQTKCKQGLKEMASAQPSVKVTLKEKTLSQDCSMILQSLATEPRDHNNCCALRTETTTSNKETGKTI